MGHRVVVMELNIVVQLGTLFTGLKEMNDEMRLIKLAEMQITPKTRRRAKRFRGSRLNGVNPDK